MYDAVVAGAGPAGAAAAKALCEAGRRVLLVERFRLPRYKSCSGILIKKSLGLVKQYFGEEVPSAVCCAPVENRGMIFTDDKGREYAFRQEGRNVWRSAFDGWLVAKAAVPPRLPVKKRTALFGSRCRTGNAVKCGQGICWTARA